MGELVRQGEGRGRRLGQLAAGVHGRHARRRPLVRQEDGERGREGTGQGEEDEGDAREVGGGPRQQGHQGGRGKGGGE